MRDGRCSQLAALGLLRRPEFCEPVVPPVAGGLRCGGTFALSGGGTGLGVVPPVGRGLRCGSHSGSLTCIPVSRSSRP